MISIAHLITTLETGGAELMLARLVAGMNRDEFENRVISLVPGGRAQAMIEAAGIPVTTVGMSRGRPNPAGLMRLTGELRRNRPDVLQTWLYHADLLGLLAGRLAGLDSVLWNVRCSEIYGASKATRLVRRVLRTCSPLPSAIVSNSHAGVDVHAAFGYSARRWVVIPNGIDIERFRPRPESRERMQALLRIPDGSFVIGTVGRADPQKDYRTFLDAACRFVESRPEARLIFVIAGKGIEDSGVADHLPARCRERIRFPGEVDDVPGILSAFDVFTLSSVAAEGFPNVVAEAMACGVPSVVTDVGDAARIVGNAGIVVPPRSPEAIVGAWETLLDDAKTMDELGASARARIVERFSLSTVIGAYERLYRDVVAGGREF
jgi:glycosyltransferase involved in cell wall biosynthesis